MSTRENSASPQSRGVDMDMDKQSDAKPDAKVVVITNLTRNVVEAHLQAIFGFYGVIVKVDLPTYAKCACISHNPSKLRVFSC
jgi:RNA-binding protein with serine-rich domain 1